MTRASSYPAFSPVPFLRTVLLALFLMSLCVWQRAHARGKVCFFADSLEGSADPHAPRTVLRGNARMYFADLEIHADKIEISGDDYHLVTATGNVRGEKKTQHLTFSAQSLHFSRNAHTTELLGAAQISDKRENVMARAERIVYHEKNETLLLQMNVSLTYQDLQCQAMFGMYYRKSIFLELSGAPRVSDRGNLFQAERITLNMARREIQLHGKVQGSILKPYEWEQHR